MAKSPTLSDITNILTSVPTINANNDRIEEALQNTLSRDGSTPNQMQADIDLNGNDLLNVRDLNVVRNLSIGDVPVMLADPGLVRNWATTPEDVQVDPDNFPGEYSAFHYLKKAQQAAELLEGNLDRYVDLDFLLAQTTTFPLDNILQTQREGYIFEVVPSGGDYVTAGGTHLRDITPDPVAKRDGEFFANSANPGSFTRLANRVFVGDAWEFTGGTPLYNTQTTWLHDSGGPQVQPGTVSITNGSLIVTGSGTQFTRLAPNGTVTIGGSIYTIRSIASDTSMTLTTPATQNLSGAAFSAGTETLGYLANVGNLVVTRNYGCGVTGAVISNGATSIFGGSFVAKTATPGAKGWGLYIEGLRAHTDAGYTHGIEIEVANLVPTVSDGFKPYGGRVEGQVWGLIVASGADPKVNPVSYAADVGIAVTGNASPFMSGLVFEHDALAVHGDGRKRAIMLPIQATISWWDSDNTQVLSVTSTASGAAKAVKVEQNNLGLTFNNGAGHPFLFVNRGPDGAQVDYPGLVATQGQGARVTASGPGANVNLNLTPKGDGNVVIPLSSIRSYGSDAGAAAGGVPIGGLYRNGNALMIRLS